MKARVSTYDTLFKEHGKLLIPLSELSSLYLGVSYRVARRHYNEGKLRLPIISMGEGQKAPLFVHLEDLAKFIDANRRLH
ncbi:pyocin activator PrtN family protein [Vibrio amylolyticus]|uniref:pyocin activator PrtN family protein n=1 Tax=Vibrio amylolyticus TaxID=2847292 RepID=UPI0035521095